MAIRRDKGLVYNEISQRDIGDSLRGQEQLSERAGAVKCF